MVDIAQLHELNKKELRHRMNEVLDQMLDLVEGRNKVPDVRRAVHELWSEGVDLLTALDLEFAARSPFEVFRQAAHRQQQAIRSRSGFPRFWQLFGFVLPRGIRSRVFEPCHQELLEDYYTSRALRQTRWSRGWLTISFTFRTTLLILDCFRVLLTDAPLQYLWKLVRYWWWFS